MFDFHIHTNNSHDSRQTIDEVCKVAVERGLRGIAICDHADVGPCYFPLTYEYISNCINEVKAAKQKYNLEIYQGIELAEYSYDTEYAEKLLALCNYDVILGSVHYVPFDSIKVAFSQIDFSAYTDEWIHGFMKCYFDCVLETAQSVDIDVLTHLTCPIRYISGKYGRCVNVMNFKNEICAILDTVIKRNIALEINTSGIDDMLNDFMPDANILKIYTEFGGRLITLGSDAHVPNRIGVGLNQAKELLRSMGFNEYHYYKNRTPYKVSLL